MFGNCETGSVAIVTAPRITNRMEMTMATMGRLMKNLDIIKSGSLDFRGRRERFRIDERAWTDLLHTFGDDALTRLQPIANDPEIADPVTDFDRPYTHF